MADVRFDSVIFEKFRKMYIDENMSVYMIANIFNRSRFYVERMLKSGDIILRGSKTFKFDKDFFEKIRIMYIDEGKSTYEIARELDRSFSYIVKILKIGGVKIRNKSERAIFSNGNVGRDSSSEIIELYKNGKSIKDISQGIDGISKTGVRRVLIREGIKLREKKKPKCIPENKIQEAISLYDAGMTYRQLGEKYDVSGTAIHDLLVLNGVKSRPGSWAKIKDEDDKKEIIEEYKRGVSKSYLALKFECSGDAISKVLRDAGVKIRNFDEAVGIKFIDIKGREFWLKSTWEVKFAQWLDSKNYEWGYEVEKFKLYYGIGYTPDFWIYRNGVLNKLIDVKGWFRSSSQKRVKMFRSKYKKLRLFVFDKLHFEKCGILLK